MSAEEPASPAEARLEQHMELLRQHEPDASSSLAARVARRARWQGAVRAPLRAAASILQSTVHGVSFLVAGRRGRR